MISQHDVDYLRSIKEELEHARGVLLAPSLTRLQETAPILERSAKALATLEAAARNSRALTPGIAYQLRRELTGLTRSVAQVRMLLSNAAAFHAGMASLMGSVAESYTPAGQLACPGEVRTMSCRG